MKLLLWGLSLVSLIQSEKAKKFRGITYSDSIIESSKDEPLQILDKAKEFTRTELKIEPGKLNVTDFYFSESIQVYHVYFRSTIPHVYKKGYVNLNLNKLGEIISHGNSFDSSEFKASGGYIYPRDLIWDVNLLGTPKNSLRQLHMSRSNTPAAEYNVFEIGNIERINEQPGNSNPDYNLYKRKIIKEPAPSLASPLGWHNPNNKRYPVLDGNNVRAQYQRKNYVKASIGGTKDYKFDFQLNKITKNARENLNIAMTNAFYYCNLLHDVFYQFGFNEVAGNFQQNNFKMGGKQGDPLEINFINTRDNFFSANYSHAPDGISPIIFINFGTYYDRLIGLDDSVVVHEYFHGVTNRLLGGPNSECGPSKEYFGLSEGWSDAVSLLFRIPKHAKKSSIMNVGTYVSQFGMRSPPYSTDKNYNDITYSKLTGKFEHYDGIIWATCIYEIFWNLKVKLPITFHDWSNPNIPIKNHPNTLLLQFIIDGLKLTPCFPSFIDARNSLIQAEQLLTKGEYECEIWCGFAKRGLGICAEPNYPYRDSFDAPSYCRCYRFKL